MSIKNDRWSALSIKERADLINRYITNGISDLKEMKKHYNSFSGKEDTKTQDKPLFDPQKIVDNVPAREWGPYKLNENHELEVKVGTNLFGAPIQYWSNKNLGKENVEFAKQIISDFEKVLNSNPNYKIELDPNYNAYKDAIHYLEHVEGLKKYLGLPYDTSVIKESEYKPTRLQGTEEKTYKFASEESPDYWGNVVDDMLLGNHKKKQYIDETLNNFTAYRDRDNKGDFVSIYDEWDYNPSVQGGNKKLNKIIDVATGGKPFIIYDRVYLDDYYNIPEEFRGNPYIAPAILTDTNAFMETE